MQITAKKMMGITRKKAQKASFAQSHNMYKNESTLLYKTHEHLYVHSRQRDALSTTLLLYPPP